jgi:hypothetical protein
MPEIEMTGAAASIFGPGFVGIRVTHSVTKRLQRADESRINGQPVIEQLSELFS